MYKVLTFYILIHNCVYALLIKIIALKKSKLFLKDKANVITSGYFSSAHNL